MTRFDLWAEQMLRLSPINRDTSTVATTANPEDGETTMFDDLIDRAAHRGNSTAGGGDAVTPTFELWMSARTG